MAGLQNTILYWLVAACTATKHRKWVRQLTKTFILKPHAKYYIILIWVFQCFTVW